MGPRTIGMVGMLVVTLLAGCMDGGDGSPPGLSGLLTDDPADRNRPVVPDAPEPFSLPPPELDRFVDLLPRVPRPQCPDAVLEDSGEAFRPTAAAPHAVSYEGPLDCAIITGAAAMAEGHTVRLSQDAGATLGVPGARFGSDLVFHVDGAQQGLTGARILSWNASGPLRIETAEPHAVTPSVLDLPLTGARLEDRVADRTGAGGTAVLHAQAALEGLATVVWDNGSRTEGMLTLAAGPHEVGGIGRLHLEHDTYHAEGQDVRLRLQDVQDLRVDGQAFTGRLGLHAHHAVLSFDGTARLEAHVDQAWRGGVPLLQAVLVVEEGPEGLVIRESSGAASLEAVRVVVDGTATTEDPLFQSGTIQDLAIRSIEAFLGAFTFGVHDPLHFEAVRLEPGGSVLLPVEAQGPVTVRVTTANGGSWSGEIG